MIEIVKVIRDIFITILALFMAFMTGIVFGCIGITKAVDKVFEETPRSNSKVSYASYYNRKRD